MRNLAIAFRTLILASAAAFLAFPPPSAEAQTASAEDDTWPSVRRVLKEGAGPLFHGPPSSDGRFFPFTDYARSQVGLLELATGKTRYISERPSDGSVDFPDYQPIISPDGDLVVYPYFKGGENAGYHLRLVGTDGPPSRVLYRNPEARYIVPMGWSPDARTILVGVSRWDGSQSIALISVDDGSIRVVKTLGFRGANACFSPDGKWIAFDFRPDENLPQRDIFILASDGSRQTTLIEHPANDRVSGWTQDGSAILFSSDRMGTPGFWSVKVTDGVPEGDPVLVRPDVWGLQESGIGFAENGSFFYRVISGKSEVYTTTVDLETGVVLSPPAAIGGRRRVNRNNSPQWSPDGQYVAFVADHEPMGSARPGELSIVIHSPATGESREIFPKLSAFLAPVWSLDGQSFLIGGADEKRRNGFFRVDGLTGTTTTLAREVRPSDIQQAADGKTVYYHNRYPPTVGVVKHNLETGEITRLYVEQGNPESGAFFSGGEYMFRDLVLSPDGHQLALISYFGDAVLVMDTSGGPPRELVQLAQDNEMNRDVDIAKLAWAKDGEHILFTKQTGTEGSSELWRVPAEGGEAVKISSEFPAPGTWELHPDGRQIVYFRRQMEREIWVMEDFLDLEHMRTSLLQP